MTEPENINEHYKEEYRNKHTNSVDSVDSVDSLFAELLNTDAIFDPMFDNYINFSETNYLTIEELAIFIDNMPLPEKDKEILKTRARRELKFNPIAFIKDKFKEYILDIYTYIPEDLQLKFFEFILYYNKISDNQRFNGKGMTKRKKQKKRRKTYKYKKSRK